MRGIGSAFTSHEITSQLLQWVTLSAKPCHFTLSTLCSSRTRVSAGSSWWVAPSWWVALLARSFISAPSGVMANSPCTVFPADEFPASLDSLDLKPGIGSGNIMHKTAYAQKSEWKRWEGYVSLLRKSSPQELVTPVWRVLFHSLFVLFATSWVAQYFRQQRFMEKIDCPDSLWGKISP